MSLYRLIEQHWQQPKLWLNLILLPLSLIFSFIVYWRQRFIPSQKLPVPVIIIGNIHVGGTGKTPITATVLHTLKQSGLQLGLISRGYGRKEKHIHVLHHTSTAKQAGDEPLMLYRQTGIPTAVGSNRFATAQALLAAYPNIELIVSDDGLQHYALHRDLEIVIFPSTDIDKSLHLMPNGNLREPISRLKTTDAVIFSGTTIQQHEYIIHHARNTLHLNSQTIFTADTQASNPYRFCYPNDTLTPNQISPNARCIAIAAIARPYRFFDTLRNLGFTIHETHTLPDHAHINPTDLSSEADYIFMTEKDAIKLPNHVPNNIWILPIRANIQPDLGTWIKSTLNHKKITMPNAR